MPRTLAFVLVFALAGPVVAQDKEVPVVTYDGLGKEIFKHRGKVVVVDFWGTFCPPCIKELPHMAEMQKKYGPYGLVIVTVALDELNKEGRKPEEIRASISKLLKARKADELISLHLDLPNPDDWFKKLRFKEVPCVYVFDRQGKWMIENEPDHEKLEKLVKGLLAEK